MRCGAQQAYQRSAKVVQAGITIALAFDKGEEYDRVVSVCINSDGTKGREQEAAESIDTTLIPIDEYQTDTEKTTT
eukprot:4217188-Ditylum_brightwellii.AAC.1